MAIYQYKKDIGKGSGRWLILFLFGFMVGIFVMNLWADQFLTESSILNETALARLKYLEVNKNSLLIYVLKKRIGAIWMIALLSTTFLGLVSVYGYTVWLGVSMGFLMSAFAIQFGMKGIVLFLISIFPQFLLYVPAMVWLLLWGYRLTIKLYFPSKDTSVQYYSKRQMMLRFLIQFFMIHGVVIIGCLLESYVNPNFITKFLKIF